MDNIYSAYHYACKTKADREAVEELAPKVLEAADKAVLGNIGDIKYTTRTKVPNGGYWCDGQTIAKSELEKVYQMLVSGDLQCVDIDTYNNVVALNGSCGFFGLDVANESFRVPLLDDIYIKAGQVADEFGAESLPNITGDLSSGYVTKKASTSTYNKDEVSGSGAFKGDGTTPSGNAQFTSATTSWFMNGGWTFNASRSSSVYQDNAKVNPDHVKYRAYVILYNDYDIKLNIVKEYQLNNPFSLFDTKWSDHELNNTSWVVSNGGYISGAMYSSAYNELVSEYNKGEEKTDESITYRLTPKGYKIALADQEASVDELYNNEGVAWYYIIDTSTVKFKLPRTKYGFVGVRNGVGGYVAESLPNITGSSGQTDCSSFTYNPKTSGAFYSNGESKRYFMGRSGESTNTLGVLTLDASRSSSAYQDNAPVQQRATEMYLYFYVGETIQDAKLINAGKISEQINAVNSNINNAVSKIVRIVDFHQTTEAWYRLWSDDTLEQGGRCWVGDVGSNGGVNFLKPFADIPMACGSKSEYGSFSESSGCIAGLSATTITMGLRWGGDNSRGGRYCSFYAIGKIAK